MDLARRSTQHREILTGEMHCATIDLGAPGDHAICRDFLVGHTEVGGSVPGIETDLLKARRINEPVDAFAGRKLTCGVLLINALFSAAILDSGSFLAQTFKLDGDGVMSCSHRFGGHRSLLIPTGRY